MTDTDKKMSIVAFGCGNMAAPILTGLWNGLNKSGNPSHWTLYTPSQTKALVLADKFHGTCLKNLEAIPQADVYILGMKPQQLSDFAENVRGKLSSHSLVISMLAGVSLEKLKKHIDHPNVLRLMPNTPSHVGLGVLPFYAHPEILEHLAWPKIRHAFESFNKVIPCRSEQELNLVTPYFGSGPAYFYEFVQVMADDLTSRGVDPKMAQDLMIHTCLGAAEMMAQSPESPNSLRDQVTSKGGVTAQALKVFQQEDRGLKKLVREAMEAALKRNAELND
jgi:pyrroline-5-carboxylate reductase